MHTTPIIVFPPDLPSKQVVQRRRDPASASIRALVVPECQINSTQQTSDHFSLQQTKDNPTNNDPRCSVLAFPVYRAVGQALKNHLENRSFILHFTTALLQTAESYQLTLLQSPYLRSWDGSKLATQVKLLETYWLKYYVHTNSIYFYGSILLPALLERHFFLEAPAV